MGKRTNQYGFDKNLFEIAMEIGISESTLYSYLNNYRPVSDNMKQKIENYFEKVDKNLQK